MSEDSNSVSSSVGKPIRMRPRPPMNGKDAPPPVPRSYTGVRPVGESPVAEEHAIIVPSRVLSRPMSSRSGSARGVGGKSLIPFRMQWQSGSDDSVIQALHTDTQRLHSLLVSLYGLQDEQSPGLSASINSLFFETEEEQMLYKMRGMTRVAALERYSTVCAQIEAACLKLTNMLELKDKKFEIAVMDVGTNVDALLEDQQRGAIFASLVRRVLSMYTVIKNDSGSHSSSSSSNNSSNDSQTLDISGKLQKCEEILRLLSEELGYNVLPSPSSLQSGFQTGGSVIARAQYVVDLVLQAKDWTCKMLEYEQEESRKTVNELGQTIKVLRNEQQDLKGGSNSQSSNAEMEITAQKQRITEQANEIDNLRKEQSTVKTVVEQPVQSEAELQFQRQENHRLQGQVHAAKTTSAKEMDILRSTKEQQNGRLNAELEGLRVSQAEKDTLICKLQDELMMEDRRNRTLMEQLQSAFKEDSPAAQQAQADAQAKQLQKDLDLSYAQQDNEKAHFVKDVMGLREELGQLAVRVQRLRANNSSSSLVDDPAEDAALLIEQAFRRQMGALQSAMLRDSVYLKEALQRKTYEHAKLTQLHQQEITELQRTNAQTLAKLRLATNKS